MGDVLRSSTKQWNCMTKRKQRSLRRSLQHRHLPLTIFLTSCNRSKKMGGIGGLLKLLPGAGQIKEDDIDERQLGKVEAIIQSMTKREKRNPDVLNASRRKRIAAGSGTTVQDVNRLMKQFEEMRAMMKRFGGKGKKGIGRKMFGGKMPDIFL